MTTSEPEGEISTAELAEKTSQALSQIFAILHDLTKDLDDPFHNNRHRLLEIYNIGKALGPNVEFPKVFLK
ncbi:hypothetical protein [Nocardia salmonicida]